MWTCARPAHGGTVKEAHMKKATTNYPKDSHEEFCKRCLTYNNGTCPNTKTAVIDKKCKL